MKRALLRGIVACLGAVVCSGCTDHGSTTAPFNQNEPPIAFVVQPAAGRIGSPLVIQDPRFTISRNYLIGFPGADDLLVVACDSQTTIHTFVPFGAISGQISVNLGDRVGFTQQFDVIEAVDTLSLSVVGYDISPPLTSRDSSVIDYMGHQRAWRADFRGDTIHLVRGLSTGYEFYENHFLLINSGSGQLPRLFRVWTYTKPDYPGSWTDTIRTGILKVQDWDTHGVMSGRFFGRPSINKMLNGTAGFWVEMRQ